MALDPLSRPLPQEAAGPDLRLADEVSLAFGRVHEICGNARRTLAAMLAGAMEGEVMWIQPAWLPERVNGEALCRFAAPGRFLFLYPRRPEDILWAMEEVLRSGAVPLAVADLPGPPGLVAVRRMHLAAESAAPRDAKGRGPVRPLGLLLTPGEGGAPGVESRWSLTAGHGVAGEGSAGRPAPGWNLARRRARTLPPKTWRLKRGRTGWDLAPTAAAEPV